MLTSGAILLAIAAYLALLVLVGWRAEMRGGSQGGRLRGVRYGLSLATLCSAWTYFGAVGDASNGSWLFVANALGPVIAITAGCPVWRRIAVLSKQENVGSLADFLAARYGKSRTLGILATCVATIGALPYLALQLTVLTSVWTFMTDTAPAGAAQALLMIAVLVLIAMVFGTRHPSLTQHSRGFVSMIAVESCVKLAGLLGVAALCVVLFAHFPAGAHLAAASVPPVRSYPSLTFFTLTLLCVGTAFTLPRQFHLSFVTLEKVEDIAVAARVVPAYFGLWVAATLVIATAIRGHFGMPGVNSHLQILVIPVLHSNLPLAMLALIGGMSAGAAMVIVEMTAISAMVSNEIVLPLFARSMRQRLTGHNLGRSILRVRRVTIVAMGALAWLYYLGVRDIEGPTELGLTALTAFAQLLPPLLCGIYWRRAHARGAIAGIAAGMTLWAVAIAGPALVLPSAPGAGLTALWPALAVWRPEIAIIASLLLNCTLMVLVSLRSAPSLIDTIQANSFVASTQPAGAMGAHRIHATVGDLRRLLEQFLGDAEANRALLDFRKNTRLAELNDGAALDPVLVRSAERLLAGVIGAPSARNVVAIALAAESQGAREISRILDEAGHAVHFSRELLQTTLDSLPQGVSVVDPRLQIVAWNNRCLQLLQVSFEEPYVGKPLAELLRGDIADAAARALRNHITARRETMVARQRFRDELPLPDGRTLSITGVALAGGDFLTTIADVSDLKQAERVLVQSNEELEQRVDERTRELISTNVELAAAKQLAERAFGAQRRFVAAASHDLVQPLHAARLFIGNALNSEDQNPFLTELLNRADQSVEGAHRLLRALLNLSQLETGALTAKAEPVDAGALLNSLAGEFSAMAEARGLELVVLPTRRWVRSDPDLLRSMLQNLLVNALRYTARGRVVIIPRPVGKPWGSALRFEVRDTGVGIAPNKLSAAFREYNRLAEGRDMAEGAGLGLSIAARIGQMLDHPIAARSRPGAGSVFSITVPVSAAALRPPQATVTMADLRGLRVLCVDDDADVLLSTRFLIERWGGSVTALASAEDALAIAGPWDVVIADFHLGGATGLDLLRALAGAALRLLVTATPPESLDADLAGEGIELMTKPIAPLLLQQTLMRCAAALYPTEVERSRASASS